MVQQKFGTTLEIGHIHCQPAVASLGPSIVELVPGRSSPTWTTPAHLAFKICPLLPFPTTWRMGAHGKSWRNMLLVGGSSWMIFVVTADHGQQLSDVFHVPAPQGAADSHAGWKVEISGEHVCSSLPPNCHDDEFNSCS